MPYSRDAKYYHKRQRNPKDFQKKSFRTLPVKNSPYTGKKYDKKGVLVVVGKLKNCRKNCWKIQSILVPKRLKIK